MAPRAWIVALAVACAHGIRQEAVTELLAAPLPEEQPRQLAQRSSDEEPSSFAEQRRPRGPASRTHPVLDSRHWDADGHPCKPNGSDAFVYAFLMGSESCSPARWCEKARKSESERTDPWEPHAPPYVDQNGAPCDLREKTHGQVVFAEEVISREHHTFGKTVAVNICHPRDWSDVLAEPKDKYVHDSDQTPCFPTAMCAIRNGKWRNLMGNSCDPKAYCRGEVEPRAWLGFPGRIAGGSAKTHPLPDLPKEPTICQDLLGGGHASAADDPHLVSLTGERFDVRQPGLHSLLRVPFGATAAERPLLALDADLHATEGAPCSLYIKMVTLSGLWLDGRAVRVRTASAGGGDGARQATLSVQVAADAAGSSRAAAGTATERTWARFGSPEANESLQAASGRMVRAAAVHKEELGSFSEGQAFLFELLGAKPAIITVAQGSHQALNVALEGMAGLGEARLGGLLGTEPHERALEEPTEECRESRAKVSEGGSLLLGLVDQVSGDFASESQPRGHGDDGGVLSRMTAAWQ